MKRNILLALVAALTISMVATGVAFAQGGPGGNGGNGVGTGVVTGTNMDVTLNNYMTPAMAEVLGLSVDEVSVHLASGETFSTIALSLGYTTDQLPALMTSVRTAAVNLAIADGVITTEQAASLLDNQYGGNTRGNGNGAASMSGSNAGAFLGTGAGVCTADSACIPQSNTSPMGGSMHRGGR